MPENNPQPLGADSEIFQDEYYNNSSQRLERHIHIDNRGEYDYNISNFIFKKAGYTQTYIAIHTTGIPNGVTLRLCDENSNQLYSPVDTNKNWITTACSITVGETDIIPLPAQFDSQLSNHVPFPVGTYNWKLIFDGNDYYEETELPLTVEIRDFKVWDIQTPTIYPDEGVKVKIQTNANTLYPPTSDMSLFLTNNATYDYETGIITYPNSDIDSTVGKHTQVINQSINCFIDYEIKNPYQIVNGTYLTASWTDTFNYSQVNANQNVAALSIGAKNKPSQWYMTYDKITVKINNQILPSLGPAGGDTNQTKYYSRSLFPPGTYNCEVTVEHNNTNFIVNNVFQVTTEDCNLILTSSTNYIGVDSSDSFTLIAEYKYEDTPIPNATIGFFDEQNILKTTVTDENGQAYYTGNKSGVYIAKIFNGNTNEVLLESNTYKVYDVQYVSNLDIDSQGNLSVSNYIGEYNATELINDIEIKDDANLYTTQDINADPNNIVTDINIGDDGNLTYTKLNDI